MKADHYIITGVVLLLGSLAWMVMDSGASPSTASGPGAGSAQISSAVATGQPVLLEFYADWCGPCKAVAPILEALSKEWSGKARIVRVNVDEQPELARKYGARSIPLFVVLRKGQESGRAVGGLPRASIESLVFP